jgi:uncharacterized protein YbcC (UPF0753/DUF2309 family)
LIYASTDESDPQTLSSDSALERLKQHIEHAAHLLPTQGPITVFVHHNTLHAFEDLSFDEGVQAGGKLFGCHAYLQEEDYRKQLEKGRIREQDLQAVLLHDLAEDADSLVASLGTRYALRLAMLQFPLHTGTSAELRWVIAETDALRKFRVEVAPEIRERMIADTRRWVMRDLRSGGADREQAAKQLLEDVSVLFDVPSIETWSDDTWEAFVLNFLWKVCRRAVQMVDEDSGKEFEPDQPSTIGRRHRDLLLDVTGVDADLTVQEVLIPFISAFTDQGFSDWELPYREAGCYQAFLNQYGKAFCGPTTFLANLKQEVRRLKELSLSPLESIEDSLKLLGVSELEEENFITQTLLALRGWAGMVWQLETNAEWTPNPAANGSLIEYLAVQLILDRVSAFVIAKKCLNYIGKLADLRSEAQQKVCTTTKRFKVGEHVEKTAFQIFQLAQVRGWKPEDLLHLSAQQWRSLVAEMDAFTSLERRRVYHMAYERKYRNETLDAIHVHSKRRRIDPNFSSPQTARPKFQAVCCIDDREESFRRHLEEVAPDCETFGLAGFYGVAMYYRGAEDAHFTPLCPVAIKPRHFVVEQPQYSAVEAERHRAQARRRLGRASHSTHRGSRSVFGGVLTGLFGSLAAFPLIARVLFPRLTSRLNRLFGSFVRTPNTELEIERLEVAPGPENGHIGYAVEEMADIVEGGLRAIGLADTSKIARMMLVFGHGSASLNNPHESAYNCGACSGGRGGPNARAFAHMANDSRVRELLALRGLAISEDTHFVGGYHNTCDDSVTFFDLDDIPKRHRPLFEEVRQAVDEARQLDAHERCRRFESAESNLSFEEALKHVEARSEDLSQARPEYNHATNALCLVGRREWTRGLFLDRRAFLTSYDPAQDDERSSILEGLLRAVIPVCAGISLEYYFSTVDVEGYGCGSKLPHNITSLLGVMTGASSDLRPGLSAQMVEIHEPMRILFVIESTPAAMQRIIDENDAIKRLVCGGWVQLAVLDANTSQLSHYMDREFLPYDPESLQLATTTSSTDWYRGWRQHLGFASIFESQVNQNKSAEVTAMQ